MKTFFLQEIVESFFVFIFVFLAKEFLGKNDADAFLVCLLEIDVESNRALVWTFNQVVGLVDTVGDVDGLKIFLHYGHVAQADETCQVAVKNV